MARGSQAAVAAVVVVTVGVLVGSASAVFPYGYYGAPSVVYRQPTYYNAPPISYPAIYTDVPMRPITVREDVRALLPCPNEGFFVHPTNSSRFYRCVDPIGTGKLFVRYMFECLAGFVFVPDPGVETCIPGSAVVMGSGQPPTTGPSAGASVSPVTPTVSSAPVTDPPVTVAPITNPPATAAPVTNPPVTDIPVTSPPVTVLPATDTPVSVPATAAPVSPAESTAPPSPDDGCNGQYVQHEMYCNVYRRCNETDVRYMCPQGTAFNEQRQMCRISAYDEELCRGKMVGAASSQTRAELVDGHILLPEDAVLVPIFAFPHTQTQVATNPHSLRTPNVPQSHPYNHPHPGSDYPASPYSTKVASQSLSLVRPSPWASLYAAGGYGSQPVSVNNVRNPQTHLHFPYHYSYTQGGSDVGLGYGLPYYTV